LLENNDNHFKDDKDTYQIPPRETINDAKTEFVPDTTNDDSASNDEDEHLNNNDPNIKDPTLRRSERQRKIPSYQKDYIHQVNSSINLKQFIHN